MENDLRDEEVKTHNFKKEIEERDCEIDKLAEQIVFKNSEISHQEEVISELERKLIDSKAEINRLREVITEISKLSNS